MRVIVRYLTESAEHLTIVTKEVKFDVLGESPDVSNVIITTKLWTEEQALWAARDLLKLQLGEGQKVVT